MGKKRGWHIHRVVAPPVLSNPSTGLSLFVVFYTRSKCKYAKPQKTYMSGRDELEVYQKFTRQTKGANP